MRPLISAAMIVRDEAHHLGGCLSSIRSLVDEIVIVDTGSTDDTVAIAKGFGARVDHLPWADDFATPRNRSLELARGQWILYLDADERAEPLDVPGFRRRLASAPEPALRVRFRSRPGLTPYWEYRLWRSDPRIRFARRMHETMVPAIMALAAAEGRAVGDSELSVVHIGYEGDQSHKHRRNLPIIQAQLAARPDDAYVQTHLAEVLAATGDESGADAAYERAVVLARRAPDVTGQVAFTGLIQHRIRQGADVGELLTEALRLYPDSLWFPWHQAQREIDQGRHAAALEWLERLDVDSARPVEDVCGYPVELLDVDVPAARALCHFRLGQYAEAARAYAQAERRAPDRRQLGLLRQLCEHRTLTRANGTPTAPLPAPDTGGWHRRRLLDGITLEVAGVPVGLQVTDAARAAAVHSLLGRLPQTERAAAVELTFDGHRQPVPPPPEDGAELHAWYRPDGVFVSQPGGLSGYTRGPRARLGGWTRDLTRSFGIAAPPLLGALLAEHGRFLLHAGAIAREGEAVLLLGQSGAGKSTVVLAALDAGWQALSDDFVVLREGSAGVTVNGLPRRLAVPGEILGARAADLPAMDDPRRRVRMPFAAWDMGAHPLRACLIIDHGSADVTELEAVGGPEMLSGLLEALVCQRRTTIRRYFPIAARACASPGHRVRQARDPAIRLAETSRALAPDRLATEGQRTTW